MNAIIAFKEIQTERRPDGYQPETILYNLDRVNSYFEAQGLPTMPVPLQWELLIKLAQDRVLEFDLIVDDKPVPSNRLLGMHNNYKSFSKNVVYSAQLSDEFMHLYHYLAGTLGDDFQTQTPQAESPNSMSVSVFERDNKLMLSFGGQVFQAGRLNDGSMIHKLLTKLMTLPSTEPVTAIELFPNHRNVNFRQIIAKSGYSWMEPLLQPYTAKTIGMLKPKQLSAKELNYMASQINENYRKPIEEYLYNLN